MMIYHEDHIIHVFVFHQFRLKPEFIQINLFQILEI
jgi:hypothetical protein